MKKIIALILCLSLMLALAACGTREPITPELFMFHATEVGFTVTSYDGVNISDDGYELVVLAKSDEANAQIIVFETEKQAKENFADAVHATQQEEVAVEKQVSSSTYAKFYCSNGDEYTAICRIGTSLFYGKEDSNNGMVRALMEKIGY